MSKVKRKQIHNVETFPHSFEIIEIYSHELDRKEIDTQLFWTAYLTGFLQHIFSSMNVYSAI